MVNQCLAATQPAVCYLRQMARVLSTLAMLPPAPDTLLPNLEWPQHSALSQLLAESSYTGEDKPAITYACEHDLSVLHC